MKRLFHSKFRLSMNLLAVAVTTATLSHSGVAAPASSGTSHYGRWQVEESDKHFSVRGRLYRTIDISRCGRDLCGISVNDRGACGVTLFRIPGSHPGSELLRGRGVWGSVKKNVVVDLYDGPDAPGIKIDLGNGWDFSERGGNMPMFSAYYVPRGNAQCRAR